MERSEQKRLLVVFGGHISRLFLQCHSGFSHRDVAFLVSIIEREHVAEAACQQASLLSDPIQDLFLASMA
jgi:hypothetical protein